MMAFALDMAVVIFVFIAITVGSIFAVEAIAVWLERRYARQRHQDYLDRGVDILESYLEDQ